MVKQESDLTNRELIISFDKHKAVVSEAGGYKIMTRDFPYLEKATLLSWKLISFTEIDIVQVIIG